MEKEYYCRCGEKMKKNVSLFSISFTCPKRTTYNFFRHTNQILFKYKKIVIKKTEKNLFLIKRKN